MLRRAGEHALARLREAGMPVYRLVDVADIRAPSDLKNGAGRLFCRTLLTAEPKFAKIGGDGAPAVMRKQWTVELTGPDPAAGEQTFLNVLLATDKQTDKMPECSAKADGAKLTVQVDKLSYTFDGK